MLKTHQSVVYIITCAHYQRNLFDKLRCIGWGSIQDGVLLFHYLLLTGGVLEICMGGVVIKSGALIELIRYSIGTLSPHLIKCCSENSYGGLSAKLLSSLQIAQKNMAIVCFLYWFSI